jgi:ubiquinol-cytochrome c reductase iron-sulfur subunit
MTDRPPLSLEAGDRAPSAQVPHDFRRRNFLYASTALLGAAGLVAAAWPIIDQMNPDAATRAKGDVVEVGIADLSIGEQRVVRWRNWPIVVVRRSDAALAWLREHPAGARPGPPPPARARREPPFADNWHRSADPAYGVFVGWCSWCQCAPLQSEPEIPGGTICPCCASRFDAAGRPSHGPAQYPLLVPPYSREGSRLLIGKTKPGEPVPTELLL